MRIALLADLHGNLSALDAVFADITDAGGADTILALGDLAMLGPQPAEVIDRLRSAGCAVIQGNTDTWYGGIFGPDYVPRDEREAGIVKMAHWARPFLGEERVAYLLGLPFSWRGELGDGESLLAVHGSPRRIDEPVSPDAPERLLDELLDGVGCSVLAFGHTHRALVRRRFRFQR